MKNKILILGSVTTIVLTILWKLNFIDEPTAALGAPIFTLIGYFLVDNAKLNLDNRRIINQKAKEEQNNSSKNIYQSHSGSGDNVAGDKIINK